MPTPSTLGSSSASKYFDDMVEVSGLEDFQKILDSGDLDLSVFKENMSYLGFDKQKIAKLAAKQLGGKLVTKLLFLGAMRGTNLKKIIEKSVKVDPEIKKAFEEKRILSGGTGALDLTMGRLLGTFPEVATFYSIKFPFAKKLEDQECPSALQWPAAASLPMSSVVRIHHVRFSRAFSETIGSSFSEKYYRAAFNGQLKVERLDPLVLALCGTPSNYESQNVDLETIFRDTEPGGVKLGKRKEVAFVPPQLGR